jgi:hypothetical protein
MLRIWLRAHEIELEQVSPGSLIESDDYLGTLTWHELTVGGPRLRMRFYPSTSNRPRLTDLLPFFGEERHCA